MAMDTTALDALQAAYKAAVELWIAAIKKEEDLASGDHSVAEIDAWEEAGYEEEDLRTKVKRAKKAYESALRREFFGM